MTSQVTLQRLVDMVLDERATTDLREYFNVGPNARHLPRYTGSYFERLEGGGDRRETQDIITAADVVALQMLSVVIPGEVALDLLAGQLGRDIADHLRGIPTQVPLGAAAAAGLLDRGAHAWAAWDILVAQEDVGWVTANKLLARKRPQLIPVYDSVVKCALRPGGGVWAWFQDMFAQDGGRLPATLQKVRDSAGVPPEIGVPRVFDVIVWMQHRSDHRRSGCAGLG